MRAKNRDLQFPVSQELDGPICMLSFNIILALLWLYLIFDKDGGDKERASRGMNNKVPAWWELNWKLVAFLLVWFMPKSEKEEGWEPGAGHLTTCCSITDFSAFSVFDMR